MKIRKNDIGKAVLVRYDDVGRLDGILIDIVEHSLPPRNSQPPRHFKQAKVFFLSDNVIDDVEFSQVVEIGKRIQIPA